MGILRINATNELPEIFLDSYNSTLSFSGISKPENIFELFNTLMKWINESKNDFKNKIICNFYFKYVNTSSKKMIFELLQELKKIAIEKELSLEVNWSHRKIDDDILEIGTEFEDLISHNFNYIIK
ncbi:MAG: SiaC family regulatory phosphoprotein [Bacteroidota bacterium]